MTLNTEVKNISKNLGSGHYGNAELWEIRLPLPDCGFLPFVIKRFNIEKCSHEERPYRAIENWQRLREIGLKTPTIYRLIDSRHIMMPFLGDEDNICVGPNNPDRCSVALWGFELSKQIPNLNNLFDNMLVDVIKAASHKIIVTNDAQFFLWNKQTENVDYVWADFDCIQLDSEYDENTLKFLNIKAVYVALDRYLQNNLAEPFSSEQRIKLSEYACLKLNENCDISRVDERVHQGTQIEPLSNWSQKAPKPSKDSRVLHYP